MRAHPQPANRRQIPAAHLPGPPAAHARARHRVGRLQALAGADHRHPQPGSSLAANKPRALIQMATGSGKTFTAIGFIYRLIKFAGARRVLFLVDRANLGRQAKKEFDAYVSPYNNYKFGEEYIVQHLQGNNARHHRARDHQHHPAHVQHAQGPRAGRRRRRAQHRRDREPVQAARADRLQPGVSRSRPSTSSSPTRRTAASTTCGARCWSTSTPT